MRDGRHGCVLPAIGRKWENPLLSGKLRVESGKLGELKRGKTEQFFLIKNQKKSCHGAIMEIEKQNYHRIMEEK